MTDPLRNVVAQFPQVARTGTPRMIRRKGKGYELTALVLNKRFPSSTHQHVMAAFADHVGDEGTAYPSVTRLAAKTGLSRRAVQKALKWLTGAGLLQEVGTQKCSSGAVKVRRIDRAALDAMPDPPRGQWSKG
jgi:hypothetical protein